MPEDPQTDYGTQPQVKKPDASIPHLLSITRELKPGRDGPHL